MSASKKRTSRVLSKEDTEYICSLSRDDITTSTFIEMFGEFNGKTRFDPYDIITVPDGAYGIEGMKNKNPFKVL